MLTRQRARRFVEMVMNQRGRKGIELSIVEWKGGLTRFARNKIVQNIEQDSIIVRMRVRSGKKMVEVQFSDLSKDTVDKAYRQAISGLSTQGETDLLPLIPKQNYKRTVKRLKSLAITPMDKAKKIKQVCEEGENRGIEISGAYSVQGTVYCIANSKGLFAFWEGAQSECSVTALKDDGAGWAMEFSFGEPDVIRVAKVAMEKAEKSQHPKDINPGKYDVVLEPSAAAQLVGFLVYLACNGKFFAEGRALASHHLGKKLFSESLTVVEDYAHPMHLGMPFDADGVPRRRVVLIEKGVLKGVYHDRNSARMVKARSTGNAIMEREWSPAPMSLVVQPGTETLKSMIENTERGLLITELHYVNALDPLQVVLTGMTRNGLFWIEDGRVAYPVKNLRFTENISQAMARIKGIGRELVQMEGIAVPAMSVEGFAFSSKTDF